LIRLPGPCVAVGPGLRTSSRAYVYTSQSAPGRLVDGRSVDVAWRLRHAGEEVVFALPLAEIGAPLGGELSSVEAFTSVGSFATGPSMIVDRLTLTSTGSKR
jgi:hypothetical protein